MEAGVVRDWCRILFRLPLGLFDIPWSIFKEQLVVYFDRDGPIIIREARVLLEVLEVDFRIAKCLRDVIFPLHIPKIVMIPTDTLHTWRLVILEVRNGAPEQLDATFVGLGAPCVKR